MNSILHLPASEAYKMVGLRDTGPAKQPRLVAAAEPTRSPVRARAETGVLRRLTGRTVA